MDRGAWGVTVLLAVTDMTEQLTLSGKYLLTPWVSEIFAQAGSVCFCMCTLCQSINIPGNQISLAVCGSVGLCRFLGHWGNRMSFWGLEVCSYQIISTIASGYRLWLKHPNTPIPVISQSPSSRDRACLLHQRSPERGWTSSKELGTLGSDRSGFEFQLHSHLTGPYHLTQKIKLLNRVPRELNEMGRQNI